MNRIKVVLNDKYTSFRKRIGLRVYDGRHNA
jgi:hypothetical protein